MILPGDTLTIIGDDAQLGQIKSCLTYRCRKKVQSHEKVDLQGKLLFGKDIPYADKLSGIVKSGNVHTGW